MSSRKEIYGPVAVVTGASSGIGASYARLLAEEDILVIPGSKFGLERHFRFSSALPDDHLRSGLARFNNLVGRILA